MHRICLLMLLLALSCVAGHARAEHEDILATLKDRFVLIGDKDPDVRTMVITGVMRAADAKVRFQFMYRAPNQFSVLMGRLGNDEPPYLVADARNVVFYDPVDRKLQFLRSARTTASFFAQGPISFAWGIRGLSADATDGTGHAYQLDLKNILAPLTQSTKHMVDHLADGRQIMVFRSELNNQMRIHLDEFRASPVTRVEVSITDGTMLDLTLDVNRGLPRLPVLIPTLDAAKGRLIASELDFSTVKALDTLPVLLRSYLTALLGEEELADGMRKQIAGIAAETLDWATLTSNYEMDRGSLARIMPAW